MKKYVLFFFLIYSSLSEAQRLWQPYRITERTVNQHISLSGEGWILGYTDKPIQNFNELSSLRDVFKTSVPNSVQWSLAKAGVLPNPYAHKNFNLYTWVDEKVWYYSKTFETPSDITDKYIFLCFNGVDYFSKVWLNDTLLGEHEGMFDGPNIEISKLLKRENTPNTLTVEVRAGNFGNKTTFWEDLPKRSWGSRDHTQAKGFNPYNPKNIIKTPQLTNGNGVEMFFPVGIWRDVRLEIVPLIHLERPFLVTKQVSTQKAILHLEGELLNRAHSLLHGFHSSINKGFLNVTNIKNRIGSNPDQLKKELCKVRITLTNESKNIYQKEILVDAPNERNWFEHDVMIDKPKLWSPNGLGKQHLYQVNIELVRNNITIDKINFNHGIREIKQIKSAGPKLIDNWQNWLFVVNGQQVFVKGVNWMKQDVLLEESESRYRWLLGLAKKAGIQLLRVNGGANQESSLFMDICDEMGLMVMYDFTTANAENAERPQDVWEAQVVQTIFRIRNHPSLAIYSGGNEFNAYSKANTPLTGILERNLKIFDDTRMFVRTSPDGGSEHLYPDYDPCWFDRTCGNIPFIAETGIQSVPEAPLFYENVVDSELKDLSNLLDPNFEKNHPEFSAHIVEFGPYRIRPMLDKISTVSSTENLTIEQLAESSQVMAGEVYQISSEKMQGNYPITTGLLPWVFNRIWPTGGIQLVNYYGQPGIQYYFLKRTYEPVHVVTDLSRLLWKSGENLNLPVKITHNPNQKQKDCKVIITVLDDSFKVLAKQEKVVQISQETGVEKVIFNDYKIPNEYKDRFLFILTELKTNKNNLISRSFYMPRVTSLLDKSDVFENYIAKPVAFPILKNGPYLKPTVAQSPTTLVVENIRITVISQTQSQIKLVVKNSGKIPAFMTQIDIKGTKRSFVASDNYDWFEAGESREITIDVLWREPENKQNAFIELSAWNAAKVEIKL
jgi:beta-mannosidase